MVNTEHIPILFQWSLTVLNPDFTGVIRKSGHCIKSLSTTITLTNILWHPLVVLPFTQHLLCPSVVTANVSDTEVQGLFVTLLYQVSLNPVQLHRGPLVRPPVFTFVLCQMTVHYTVIHLHSYTLTQLHTYIVTQFNAFPSYAIAKLLGNPQPLSYWGIDQRSKAQYCFPFLSKL